MRHALTMALQDFEGAVVLVSHERQLIATVCDELLLVHAGRCTEFEGDLQDYAKWLREARQQQINAQNALAKAQVVETEAKPVVVAKVDKEAQRKLAASVVSRLVRFARISKNAKGKSTSYNPSGRN